MSGWAPVCKDCATAEDATIRLCDPEIACARCGRASEYLAIDYEEYEHLPRASPKEAEP